MSDRFTVTRATEHGWWNTNGIVGEWWPTREAAQRSADRMNDQMEDAGDDYRLSSATRKEWAERALKAEAERDRLRGALEAIEIVSRVHKTNDKPFLKTAL